MKVAKHSKIILTRIRLPVKIAFYNNSLHVQNETGFLLNFASKQYFLLKQLYEIWQRGTKNKINKVFFYETSS